MSRDGITEIISWNGMYCMPSSVVSDHGVTSVVSDHRVTMIIDPI